MKLTVILATTLAMAAFAPGRDARAVPAYTFTNFDPSGTSAASGANALNNAGQIVGYYTAPGGSYGYIYSPTTGATTTLNYVSDPSSSPRTIATGINDLGQVVGTNGGPATSQYRSFVFDSVSGTYTAINTPPNTGSLPGYGVEVSGINNADQIVGAFGFAMAFDRGQIYQTQEGFLMTLGSSSIVELASIGAGSYGINNLGQVLGSFYKPGTLVNSMYLLLPAPGAFSVFEPPVGTYIAVPNGARGANDVGQVAGSASNGTISQGFVFDIASGLSTSLSDPSGVNGTYLTGINNSDEVVGYYLDAQNVAHSFFATPQNTTVPEPASVVLLGSACIGFLGWSRRRG